MQTIQELTRTSGNSVNNRLGPAPEREKGINTTKAQDRGDICHAFKKQQSDESNRNCFPGHRQRDARLSGCPGCSSLVEAKVSSSAGAIWTTRVSEMETKTH